MAQLDYSEICRRAVASAAKAGVSLDYTPESIERLEMLLQGQCEYAANNAVSDTYTWNTAVIFGVYLGQTLLRCCLAEHGFNWAQDGEGVPYLFKDKDTAVYPVNKVWKRLRNNDGDNVRAFYEISCAIAEGKLKLN